MKRYNKFKEEYKKGLTQRESLLISALARQDRKIFSTEDARAVTEGDAKKMMREIVRLGSGNGNTVKGIA